VLEGVQATLGRGTLLAYPVMGVRVSISDLICSKSTNSATLRHCAFQACSMALAGVNKVLMEPVMKLEITAPEEYVGSILSDVTGVRHGHVLLSLSLFPFFFLYFPTQMRRIFHYFITIKFQGKANSSQ